LCFVSVFQIVYGSPYRDDKRVVGVFCAFSMRHASFTDVLVISLSMVRVMIFLVTKRLSEVTTSEIL
jgi:hypothetical protein